MKPEEIRAIEKKLEELAESSKVPWKTIFWVLWGAVHKIALNLVKRTHCLRDVVDALEELNAGKYLVQELLPLVERKDPELAKKLEGLTKEAAKKETELWRFIFG